jgi:hypothetical protein
MEDGRPHTVHLLFRCRMQTFSSHLTQVSSASNHARCLARAVKRSNLGFQATVTASRSRLGLNARLQDPSRIHKTLLICNDPIAYPYRDPRSLQPGRCPPLQAPPEKLSHAPGAQADFGVGFEVYSLVQSFISYAFKASRMQATGGHIRLRQGGRSPLRTPPEEFRRAPDVRAGPDGLWDRPERARCKPYQHAASTCSCFYIYRCFLLILLFHCHS